MSGTGGTPGGTRDGARARRHREQLFAEARASGMTQREAAITEGYAATRAAKFGAELEALPRVKAMISAARDAIVAAARTVSTAYAPRIVRELEAVPFSDIGQVFASSPAGALQLEPLTEWTESTRRAVSSIKVRDGLDRDGNAVTVTELRFWPKLEALKRLREQLGMATPEGTPATEVGVRVVRE